MACPGVGLTTEPILTWFVYANFGITVLTLFTTSSRPARTPTPQERAGLR